MLFTEHANYGLPDCLKLEFGLATTPYVDIQIGEAGCFCVRLRTIKPNALQLGRTLHEYSAIIVSNTQI